jgi:hypothetical protein
MRWCADAPLRARTRLEVQACGDVPAQLQSDRIPVFGEVHTRR